MSRLLICGFGPFPAAPDNPAGAAVRRLRDEEWAPPGAHAAYALLPTVWAEAAETASAALRADKCDGVLLVGVAVGAAAFRIETLARNHAHPGRPDAAGRLWTPGVIDPEGPDMRDATAPTEAMRAAVAGAGLPVTLSNDAGDYLCNFAFYRMLDAAPACGFLHVPAIGETVGLDDIVHAVQASATAFAAQLS